MTDEEYAATLRRVGYFIQNPELKMKDDIIDHLYSMASKIDGRESIKRPKKWANMKTGNITDKQAELER